jgi:hypothetical protein
MRVQALPGHVGVVYIRVQQLAQDNVGAAQLGFAPERFGAADGQGVDRGHEPPAAIECRESVSQPRARVPCLVTRNHWLLPRTPLGVHAPRARALACPPHLSQACSSSASSRSTQTSGRKPPSAATE